MTDDNDSSMQDDKKCRRTVDNSILSGIYGMAFIGGLIYYLQHATSFWNGVWGIIKAIVWPAVLMYKVLELLQM